MAGNRLTQLNSSQRGLNRLRPLHLCMISACSLLCHLRAAYPHHRIRNYPITSQSPHLLILQWLISLLTQLNLLSNRQQLTPLKSQSFPFHRSQDPTNRLPTEKRFGASQMNCPFTTQIAELRPSCFRGCLPLLRATTPSSNPHSCNLGAPAIRIKRYSLEEVLRNSLLR